MQALDADAIVSGRYNTPAWSITPLLFGAMALAFLRPFTARVLRMKWSLPLISFISILLMAGRIAIDLSQDIPSSISEMNLRHMAVLPHTLEVIIGALASILLLEIKKARQFSWLTRDWPLLGVLGLMLALLGVTTAMGGRIGAFLIVHGPILPLALLFVVAVYENNGWLERVSSRSWVNTAGQMSILVYLLHIPIFHWGISLAYKLGGDYGIVRNWSYAIGVLMVSMIAARYLWKPLDRIQKRVAAYWVEQFDRPDHAEAPPLSVQAASNRG
jgi:peptidoglycan/LPS O-acetylase OafA/YrhL